MKRLHSEAANGTPADTADMTERRTAILSRLEEINGVAVPAGFASSVGKTELHWDHVMQEMVSKPVCSLETYSSLGLSSCYVKAA